MNDVEIESLLDEAGYRYDPLCGRYIESLEGASDSDDIDDFPSEDIADQLEIPLDDLLRWEVEQRADTR